MKSNEFQKEFDDSVRSYRIVTGLVSMFCVYNVSLMDYIVSVGYGAIVDTWWFKHDSFEPVWATISFGLSIGVYYVFDYAYPAKFKKYLINPKAREKEDETYEAYLALPSAIAYLAPIMLYDVFVPRRVVPEVAPSFLSLVGGIICALFLYDLFFFPIHYFFHKGPEVLRSFHKRHHEASTLRGKEVIRHSLVDGTMQVVTNILVLNILRLAPFTRMIYNSVITYLLTEIHGGYDMPWMIHNLLPKGVLGGPRRHELHHQTGRVNYHQFFTYFDDLLGLGADN